MENRQHLRIKKPMDVTWSVPQEGIAGIGLAINISSSGMQVLLDHAFKPLKQFVITIKAEKSEAEAPFLNKTGKVVWFRRIKTAQYAYQCGVEFLKDQPYDPKLNQWLDHSTAELAQTLNVSILNNYLS